MSKTEIAQQALGLPEHDRFELAHILWASLDDPNAHRDLTLPEWQRQLLDERLKASADEVGEDWERVKAEMWPEGL